MCVDGLFIVGVTAHGDKGRDSADGGCLTLLHRHVGFATQAHFRQDIGV